VLLLLLIIIIDGGNHDEKRIRGLFCYSDIAISGCLCGNVMLAEMAMTDAAMKL